ncbi:hypothetical protein QYF36_018361 [Acer negundo]|nr:hypothetical protein QYF36_018361 [Acer negundo]
MYTSAPPEVHITQLKLSVDNLEKERDFYLTNLKDVEILCQFPRIEHLTIVRAIQKIFYATDDNSETSTAMMIFLQYNGAILTNNPEVIDCIPELGILRQILYATKDNSEAPAVMMMSLQHNEAILTNNPKVIDCNPELEHGIL